MFFPLRIDLSCKLHKINLVMTMAKEFESSLVLIKPNAVQRGIVGDIIRRFERKGLRIDAIKMLRMDKKLAEEHYAEHVGKYYYEELIEFITSGPVIAMVISGPDAISACRYVVGDTDPLKAQPGTIRGEYAITICRNIIHSSDSSKTAEKEIARFFKKSEILAYHLDTEADI